jgi:hypothetical protein
VIPRRWGWALAVACAGFHEAAADEPTAPVAVFRTDWGIQLGPITLTPGGFLEFTSIYRKRNETADLGSSFGSIPFPNNNNYYIKEFRETARDTRVSLLAQGPPGYDYKGEGFLETDFVSAGTNSNGNQSNSYTLRVRQAYLVWSRPDLGWTIMAGQAWSLVTPYKNGLVDRQEDIPLGDDGQFYVGYNWARQTQFRLVKTFSPAVALGLSLESPQNVLKGSVPTGATVGNPGGPGLNSGASYSTDIAPDAILKLALDPGYGHYELYSLTRFLHDRAPSVPGNLSSEASHTTVAQSFGAGLILPLWGKWLELHATTLIGHGNGRYGSAQLSDSTYNTGNGSIAALREQQGLVGLIAHPLEALDAYAYGGLEQQTAAYGIVPDNNLACTTNFASVGALPTSAECSVGKVREVAGGFVWKAYRGPLGYVTVGPEVEYVKDTTYTAKNGTSAETNNVMVYFTIRYYP